jgi:hypothetical protein
MTTDKTPNDESMPKPEENYRQFLAAMRHSGFFRPSSLGIRH